MNGEGYGDGWASDRRDSFTEIAAASAAGYLPAAVELEHLLWCLAEAEEAINPLRLASRWANLGRLDDERHAAALDLLRDLDAIESALGPLTTAALRDGTVRSMTDRRRKIELVTVERLARVPGEVWERFTTELFAVWELQVGSHLARALRC